MSPARAKASDYAEDVKKLLLEACDYFMCMIITEDTYPGDVKQGEFVMRAWKQACDASEQPVQYILSDRMKRIVSAPVICLIPAHVRTLPRSISGSPTPEVTHRLPSAATLL